MEKFDDVAVGPMHIEVRDLRLIVAIAHSGSVTAAADALHLTQSTLSHHLADLERRIGGRLFHRTGHRLSITPLGNRFRANAEPLLDDVRAFEQALQNRIDQPVGVVRFATECNTTYPWFGRLAIAFRREWPQVELTLVTAATAQPLVELERGTVDIAITTRRVRQRQLKVATLFSDELVAIVPPDHAWGRKKRVELEAFRDVHLLTFAKDPLHSDFVRDVLMPAGVLPTKTSGTQQTESLFEFSKAGIGVAVVARWIAKHVLDSGELVAVRIGRAGLYRTWRAVWLPSYPTPEWLETFARLLRLENRQ